MRETLILFKDKFVHPIALSFVVSFIVNNYKAFLYIFSTEKPSLVIKYLDTYNFFVVWPLTISILSPFLFVIGDKYLELANKLKDRIENLKTVDEDYRQKREDLIDETRRVTLNRFMRENKTHFDNANTYLSHVENIISRHPGDQSTKGAIDENVQKLYAIVDKLRSYDIDSDSIMSDINSGSRK